MKVAVDVLNVLFKNVPYKELVQNFRYVDENRLVPFDKLTPETVVYWKALTGFLFAEGGGAATGINCIKIGLAGKLILSKGKGLLEVQFF